MFMESPLCPWWMGPWWIDRAQCPCEQIPPGPAGHEVGSGSTPATCVATESQGHSEPEMRYACWEPISKTMCQKRHFPPFLLITE